jgi:hypothetical protein
LIISEAILRGIGVLPTSPINKQKEADIKRRKQEVSFVHVSWAAF